MATPNKTVDISPCNTFSKEQTKLMEYADAYSKELSSLLEKQQADATKTTDAIKKMNLATDTVASLNLKQTQLTDQLKQLDKDRVASNNEIQVFTKDFESAQNERARIQKTLLPLQDEQRKLVADVTVAEAAKATLVSSQATAAAEKARLEKLLQELVAQLAALKTSTEKEIQGLLENKTIAEKQKSDAEQQIPPLEKKRVASAALAQQKGMMYKLHEGAEKGFAAQIAMKNVEIATASLRISNVTTMIESRRALVTEKTNEITKVKSQIDEQTKLLADFTAKINAPDPKKEKLNADVNANADKRAAINADIAKQSKLEAEILAKIAGPTAKIANIDANTKNVNNLIQEMKTQIAQAVDEQAKLKTASDGNSSLNTKFATDKGVIDNKIASNKSALVKVLKDKEDCENKVSACGVAKKEIDDLKATLQQYEGELTALNAQYATCNTAYENKCSATQRGAQTALIAGRKTIEDSLKSTQTEYDTKCKGKNDCDGLFSIFQAKQKIWNTEYEKQKAIKREHDICLDDTQNGCKNIYSAANSDKSTTGINIDSLKRPEGFTQVRGNDTADATHSILLSNYNSVKRDYTKLQQNVQELNNANNNENTKTSKYASKKQLYDNAIYTNILLTALTTSVLYYVFVEI